MSGRHYRVYFELFGKKMRTDVFACSDLAAEEHVKSKLKFHKTEVIPPNQTEADVITKMFEDLSDIIKGK